MSRWGKSICNTDTCRESRVCPEEKKKEKRRTSSYLSDIACRRHERWNSSKSLQIFQTWTTDTDYLSCHNCKENFGTGADHTRIFAAYWGPWLTWLNFFCDVIWYLWSWYKLELQRWWILDRAADKGIAIDSARYWDQGETFLRDISIITEH